MRGARARRPRDLVGHAERLEHRLRAPARLGGGGRSSLRGRVRAPRSASTAAIAYRRSSATTPTARCRATSPARWRCSTRAAPASSSPHPAPRPGARLRQAACATASPSSSSRPRSDEAIAVAFAARRQLRFVGRKRAFAPEAAANWPQGARTQQHRTCGRSQGLRRTASATDPSPPAPGRGGAGSRWAGCWCSTPRTSRSTCAPSDARRCSSSRSGPRCSRTPPGRLHGREPQIPRPVVIRLVTYVRIPRDAHRRKITRRAIFARDGWECQYCGSHAPRSRSTT